MPEGPNYYAIIPANVRYDKELPDKAKLLYGEITSLCNVKGYCWAENQYFADLYGVHKKSISRLIKKLEESGYIEIELIHEGRTVKERRIYMEHSVGVGTKLRRPLHKNEEVPSIYNNKDNTKQLEEEFERFWFLYDKKIDKKVCFKKWKKIKDEDKAKIFDHVPKYVKSTPDKQYRKAPEVYINRESWNNEIVTNGYEDNYGLQEL